MSNTPNAATRVGDAAAGERGHSRPRPRVGKGGSELIKNDVGRFSEEESPPTAALPHEAAPELAASRPGWALFAGIFLTSAATLLLELTLTRIFDVVLWT